LRYLILKITKTYFLFAKSEDEKKEWMDRIAQGKTDCEKHVEFVEQPARERKNSIVSQLNYLVQKSGDLEKLHKNSWKKRWFIVKDGVLYRYDTKGGKILAKILLNSDCSIEEYMPDKMNNCFEIKTGSKSIVLKAVDEQDMHEWLNAILKHKFLSDSSIEKTVQPVEHEGSKSELKPAFKVKSST